MRLEFKVRGVESDQVIEQNILASSGVPVIKITPPHTTKLAVVGGGLSAKEQVKELVNWDGDVWGINQTAQWLISEGREDVWLFSVSPTVRITTYLEGVTKAILASCCHPSLFQSLYKNVQRFHLFDGCGPASVCNTIMPSAILGYTEVSYFGCEGSFIDEAYFYRKEFREDQIIVRAGGKDYITSPDLYITTEYLAGVMLEYPERMKDKSGGLLQAMIEHKDSWEVVALSESMKGEYTEIYVPQTV